MSLVVQPRLDCEDSVSAEFQRRFEELGVERGPRSPGRRSRCSRRSCRPIRSCASASSAKRAPFRRSTIRTSVRSTTSARRPLRNRFGSWSWSSSRASRSPTGCREARCRSTRRSQRGIEIADALQQRASPRHRPPRCQARQRDADQGRREAARLRPGQVRVRAWNRRAIRPRPRGRRLPPDSTDAGDDSRHRSVHGAGAARRPRRRCSHGHLRVRRDALRDDHRPEGLRGQDAGEPDRRDSQGSPAARCRRSSRSLPLRSIASSRKCLAKDPDDRWQDASDLRDELSGSPAAASLAGGRDLACSGPAAAGVGGVGAVRDRARAVGLLALALPAAPACHLRLFDSRSRRRKA